MAPIRVAFIGLSATRGWATGAHLPYLSSTKKYVIQGILNSSKESSEAAVKAYNLDSSVKAYGSPEELAADADNFDLFVCSVRVDKHFDAVKAVLSTGKQVYVEWPLGKTLGEAEEMYALAGGARTVVGLQGRAAPIVNKIKQLIAGGAIGRVLSSSVRSSAGNFGVTEPEGIGRLFNDKKIGANMLSIHFAHLIDVVLFALSQELRDLSATVSTQRKNITLEYADGRREDIPREGPDHIVVHGHLTGGGVLSVHQRGGAPFKSEPGLSWRIYGETGEIEVTATGTFLHIGYGDDMQIKLHDFAKNDVEVVDWKVDDEWAKLPTPAQNVGRLYEAFADGKQENYADWEQAVQRHRLLDKIVESSETGQRVTV